MQVSVRLVGNFDIIRGLLWKDRNDLRYKESTLNDRKRIGHHLGHGLPWMEQHIYRVSNGISKGIETQPTFGPKYWHAYKRKFFRSHTHRYKPKQRYRAEATGRLATCAAFHKRCPPICTIFKEFH